MLQTFTVESHTLELLKRLQRTAVLKNTRLVGGTALALLMGHRVSIDLDFFGLVVGDTESIRKALLEDEIEASYLINNKTIHIFTIEGIKVDIVKYDRYQWLEPLIEIDGVRLAGLKDIAAMKVAAITNRGSRKDFVDLYFLLSKFSMEEILDLYKEKFPDMNLFATLRSLVYFSDAEEQVMPRMFQPIDWESVKQTIKEAVKRI